MNKLSQGADVTREDQERINLFSKLYSRHQEITIQMRQANEKANQHADTLSELQFNGDDDQVRYRFGQCFFTLTTLKVRELVQADKLKVKEIKDRLDAEEEEVTKKMKKLKATLYGKFGNSINLEE